MARKINFLIGAFLTISVISCTDKTNEDYRGFTKRTLTLVDSLGEIELMLPDYYDTLHSWVRHSDYPGGDERYYRFQPSHYSMRQEKNYFPDFDSIKQFFTIRHIHRLNYVHHIDSFICNPYLRKEPDTLFQFESDGVQFCYYALERELPYNSEYPFSNWNGANARYAKAYIQFNDLPMYFEFEKLNSDYDTMNFNQECLKILRSIKITGNGVIAKQ